MQSPMTHGTPALDRDEILRQTQSLRGLAMQLVRDAAAAEDVVQTAWLAEVEGRRPSDVPRAWWLRGVVRNLAARFARDRARSRRREEAVARPEAVRVTADAAAVRAETHRRLTDAVLSLDEPYRAAVLLRFFEGLAPSEIAARNGESAGAVRTRLHRAVEMLRARLDRDAAGDRRAWASALAPLIVATGAAVRPRGAETAGGGSAMATAKTSWIAAAVLLLAVAGAAIHVATDTADLPGPSVGVAPALSPERAPTSARAARTRPRTPGAPDAAPADAPAESVTTVTAAARPPQPAGVVREVKGVVVDRATGRPLAGARVMFCHVGADGGAWAWHGDDADDRGRFECGFDEEDDLSAGHMEVRVRRAGYEDVRRAAEKDEMRIELVARTHAAEPGRVVGLAVDHEGRACPGRLLVEGMDDFGAYQAQWTRADAAGTFVLEGIPAGYWRLRAEGEEDGGYVEVLVPERGEARVQLRTEPPASGDDMKNVATLEKAVADIAGVRKELDVLADHSAGEVKRGAEEIERLRTGVESMRTRVEPGRVVVVSGLPAGSSGAVARLAPSAGRGWFWRARADGTTVTFDDVPAGSYVLRLETSAGFTDAGAFEVRTEGAGPLEISLGAAK